MGPSEGTPWNNSQRKLHKRLVLVRTGGPNPEQQPADVLPPTDEDSVCSVGRGMGQKLQGIYLHSHVYGVRRSFERCGLFFQLAP